MLENLKGAGLVNGEVLMIEIWHLVNKKLHNIGCIYRILHLMDSPMQLTLDKIHHINLISLAIYPGLKHRIGMTEKVDEPSTNGIHIPGLRCNVASKHAEENVEGGKEIHVGTNGGPIEIERCHLALIILNPFRMHNPSLRGFTLAQHIPKQFSKSCHGGLTLDGPGHPSQRNIFILPKLNRCKELMHQLDIIILFKGHEVLQPKLTNNPV